VDFFLFPRLKSIMKGARFADVAAIQERVAAILRSIPKEAFADSSQKLYERCQQCVVKDGDYLKTNEVNLFVSIFCFVCFLVPFTELLRHTTYSVTNGCAGNDSLYAPSDATRQQYIVSSV
jgi:hypothetical protein